MSVQVLYPLLEWNILFMCEWSCRAAEGLPTKAAVLSAICCKWDERFSRCFLYLYKQQGQHEPKIWKQEPVKKVPLCSASCSIFNLYHVDVRSTVVKYLRWGFFVYEKSFLWQTHMLMDVLDHLTALRFIMEIPTLAVGVIGWLYKEINLFFSHPVFCFSPFLSNCFMVTWEIGEIKFSNG